MISADATQTAGDALLRAGTQISIRDGVIAALEHQIRHSGEPLGGGDAIWYGPHGCEHCGAEVVKRCVNQGPVLRLDAPAGPIYPNTPWTLHICALTPSVVNG